MMFTTNISKVNEYPDGVPSGGAMPSRPAETDEVVKANYEDLMLGIRQALYGTTERAAIGKIYG